MQLLLITRSQGLHRELAATAELERRVGGESVI
jgi:hypothetical protein